MRETVRDFNAQIYLENSRLNKNLITELKRASDVPKRISKLQGATEVSCVSRADLTIGCFTLWSVCWSWCLVMHSWKNAEDLQDIVFWMAVVEK